ncbi:EPC1, partial [Cordylochernes scorpioides]
MGKKKTFVLNREGRIVSSRFAPTEFGSSLRLALTKGFSIDIEEYALDRPMMESIGWENATTTKKNDLLGRTFAMDQDIPDYDMDSDDEQWFDEQSKKINITAYKFEDIMDRLEKSSGQQTYNLFLCVIQVITLREAKLLIKEDDDLIIAVYDYWLNKRLKTVCIKLMLCFQWYLMRNFILLQQQPLIPQVKTERRDGSTSNNPYVAFRRRSERMQTRKNRKNDETSYEKMLKLKRDLHNASTLFEMVKQREKTKRQHLHLSIEIFEKRLVKKYIESDIIIEIIFITVILFRYHCGDFNGQMLAEVMVLKTQHQVAPPLPVRITKHPVVNKQEKIRHVKPEKAIITVKKKRDYTKRKPKPTHTYTQVQANLAHLQSTSSTLYEMLTSNENVPQRKTTFIDLDDNDPDGKFAFKRKPNCSYLAVSVISYMYIYIMFNNYFFQPQKNESWDHMYQGSEYRKLRYNLLTLSKNPPNTIGFARRRMGRGGRIHFDRAYTPIDEEYCWNDIIYSNDQSSQDNSFLKEIKTEWANFKPQCPPFCAKSEMETITSLTDLESFQIHQEELFEMQRKQLECLKQKEIGINPASSHISKSSFASASHSNLPATLDSASVQFAVSALRTSSEVATTSPCASKKTAPVAKAMIGPKRQ